MSEPELGDKIRCMPNTVLCRSPEAYNDIYSLKANVQRSRTYAARVRNENDMNTLSTTDVGLHAQRRRLLNQVFTDKSIRAAGAYVTRHVDRWNELLIDGDGKEWSNPRNFADCTDSLVFDILGDLCFGKSFEIKEPGDSPLKHIPHNIVKYMQFMYPVRNPLLSYRANTDAMQITRSPFLDLLIWLKPRGLNKVFEAITPPEVETYNNFVKDSVSKRITLHQAQREKPGVEQRHDMFHFLCEAKNPDTNEPAYSEIELRAEANLLIVAGQTPLQSPFAESFSISPGMLAPTPSSSMKSAVSSEPQKRS